MKRLTVAISLFSVLAAWIAFQNTPIKAQEESGKAPKASYDGEEAAVPVIASEMRKIAPVFDATGAVVSDPTGTLWRIGDSGDAAVPFRAAEMKVAPVFDAAGVLVSDPTGTLWGAADAGEMAVSAIGADAKIAPVYDAAGVLVSDPTGTLWSAMNP